jgi:hypothetical protein
VFIALRAMLRDPEAKVLALTALGVIAIGSVVYMVLEHWGPIDAIYFCVVTLATVGYGDLHPTTDAGKIFTVFYILSGLGILAAFVTELARHRAVGHGRLSSALSSSDSPLARSAAAAGFGGAADTAEPLPVVDAKPAATDPASPRTDVGPGG